MITDASFHRWSNSQGLMNAAEVVVHMKQCQHSDVIFELLTEGIGQPGEPPHVHPHIKILSFNVRRADMLRVGRTNNSLSLGAKTLRRAVALLSLEIAAEDLHQLRVIDPGSESVWYGNQVHLVAVRGQLNSIRQTAFYVLKELCRTPGVPPSDQPGNHQLGLCLNRGESPNISADSGIHFLGGYVLFFATDERPYFIDLNTLGGNVADNAVLVLGTRIADANQQPKDGALRYARHANRRAYRASFNKCRYDRYFLRRADYVCHNSSVRQRFRIVKRKAKKDQLLSGFLHFSPARFSGLSSAPAPLFVGHRLKAAFAADLAALGSHLTHDLLDDGKLDGFSRFNGFQENAPGILDGIELLGVASPLWHTFRVARTAAGRQGLENSNRPTTEFSMGKRAMAALTR